jgi:hypothetical protein
VDVVEVLEGLGMLLLGISATLEEIARLLRGDDEDEPNA